MMRALYTVTGIVITPLVKQWLKRRAGRGKEEVARMGERFGYASLPRPTGHLLWLHAASVGEAQSVLTLVRALLAQHTDLHIVITTGTVTSAALIAQQKLERTMHQYIPVDTAPAVQRFLQHWQPDIALWVESELWPQLLWQTHDRRIPLLLINARISAQSVRNWQRWPRTIRALLSCFTAIYAGTPEDAARLTALGAQNVQDVGNLKYDAAPLPIDTALLAELTERCRHRPVWVAASTHANEEQTIAEVQQTLRTEFSDLLCILIPRHATRGDAIAADIRAQHLTLAQRSKNEAIDHTTSIYLADTMGELGSFYHFANLVFLGGSLVAVGGHNPLEPARYSCALITGMHLHNFASIMQHLRDNDALEIVPDKETLITAVAQLLRDDAKRLGMTERALLIAQHTQGASETILQHIDHLLTELPA